MTAEKRFVLTIVPTFNRAPLLPEAIESVLAQDYLFKKIFIVNDGSTDGTESVCCQYAEKYPENISYESKQNGGCSSARNDGLDLIDEETGYICFLDDDDRLLPGKFSREVELLQKNPKADFSYSDSVVYDEETKGERLQRVAAAGKPENLAIEHFLTNEAKSAAILYRVDVVKQRRFREDLKYNEDSEFFQRVAIDCKGVYCPLPGCWIRDHGGSKSRNLIEIRKAVLQAGVDILESYPAFYHSYKEDLDRQIDSNRRSVFVELVLQKRWEEARGYSAHRAQNLFLSLHLNFYYRLRRFVGRFIRKRGRWVQLLSAR